MASQCEGLLGFKRNVSSTALNRLILLQLHLEVCEAGLKLLALLGHFAQPNPALLYLFADVDDFGRKQTLHFTLGILSQLTFFC